MTISKSCDFESVQPTTLGGTEGVEGTGGTGGSGGTWGSEAGAGGVGFCMYDERAIKPVVRSKYFSLSEVEIKGLQKSLSNNKLDVSVTIDSEFLLNTDIRSLSDMSHMNAQYNETDGKNRTDAECEQDMSKPHVLVETVEGLYQCCSALSQCAEVAFDLEMHSYRTYHGITCLIQLSGGGVNYIVGADHLIDSV